MSEYTREAVEAQIQSLIDLANETTGNTDTNLTDGVNALVQRYRPEGSLDGLTNGYDVMFYDENNEGLAFYSIKQGHTINPPVYNCKNWQTSDGAVITFPYTPTEDVVFYALNSTYADQLYEFYGVDKAIYPYVTVEYFSYSPKWAVYFLTRRDSDLWFYGGLYGKYENSGFSDMGNIAGMIEFVESHIPSVSVSNGNYSFVNQERNPNYTLYTNFDLTVTQATLYRLDE